MAIAAQSGKILALSVLGGLIAGGILAGMNFVIVQPSTNIVVELVLDELIANGEYDEEEFDSQLQWINNSQKFGSVALGLAAGALIGVAYVIGKSTTRDQIRDAMVIAGIAWFVLFVVPAVKYPPSALAMFDGEAANVYYALYSGYLAVSGISALGISVGFRKIKRKDKSIAMAALYLVAVAAAFFVFPDYELDSTFPQPVLNGWRASIAVAMTVFWFAAGALCGLLWRFSSAKNAKEPRLTT